MINLNSKPLVKILGYFFLHSDESFYGAYLARELTQDSGNVCRNLELLEKNLILKSKVEGRQKYFFLNKENPLLPSIKKIFDSEYSFELNLQKILRKIVGLKEAYIYGSYARRELSHDSDIDILLVGEHDSFIARKEILVLQKSVGREISIMDYSTKEFKKAKKSDDFLIKVFSGKYIKLI